jgi:ketosteroid isomerase-like protein
MSDRQTIENLLEELYAARVRGDLEALRKLFAANATFEVMGSDKASPMPMLVKGTPSVMGVLQNMIATFELSNFSVVEMLIDGASAAVRWQATVHHAGTGQVFSTELADFITIAGGQVTAFVEFLDTALAAKVLAAK